MSDVKLRTRKHFEILADQCHVIFASNEKKYSLLSSQSSFSNSARYIINEEMCRVQLSSGYVLCKDKHCSFRTRKESDIKGNNNQKCFRFSEKDFKTKQDVCLGV